ncbi:sperm-associated antigen 8 [Sphaeramia orbicularis]|uniref:sperm-associated antigen 8 n=1 Tax=Sphaeramia orbicularis TaxID=375764 RepID=UPI0011813BFF|nr:sperm-associated antigen 8-like [Sphaeramia orbicularis]
MSATQLGRGGVRGELLEKQLAQMIREKITAEMNPPTPKTDFCSTTRTDFNADGFTTVPPEPSQVHDYKSEQAVSFWSENYQRIQRVTAVRSLNAPFRKSSHFSTPITERLDEPEPPSEN